MKERQKKEGERRKDIQKLIRKKQPTLSQNLIPQLANALFYPSKILSAEDKPLQNAELAWEGWSVRICSLSQERRAAPLTGPTCRVLRPLLFCASSLQSTA